MSDEFGTVNLRGADRARELDVLRQHYLRHREALTRMIADAPTESLAAEYARLVSDIESSLTKLDELERRPAGTRPAAPPVPPVAPPPHPARAGTQPHGDPLGAAAAAGMRPLHPEPHAESHDANEDFDLPPSEAPRAGSRILLMGLGALALVAVIGWMLWRASSDRGERPPLVEPAAVETAAPDDFQAVTETDSTAATPAAAGLVATPPTQDYGVVRKGTRVARRFQITNSSDEPVTIELARSACRCLYYMHAALIPPKGKETVTVTLDGAKAKAGELRESIRLSAKSNPELNTTLEIVGRVE